MLLYIMQRSVCLYQALNLNSLCRAGKTQAVCAGVGIMEFLFAHSCSCQARDNFADTDRTAEAKCGWSQDGGKLFHSLTHWVRKTIARTSHFVCAADFFLSILGTHRRRLLSAFQSLLFFSLRETHVRSRSCKISYVCISLHLCSNLAGQKKENSRQSKFAKRSLGI